MSIWNFGVEFSSTIFLIFFSEHENFFDFLSESNWRGFKKSAFHVSRGPFWGNVFLDLFLLFLFFGQALRPAGRKLLQNFQNCTVRVQTVVKAAFYVSRGTLIRKKFFGLFYFLSVSDKARNVFGHLAKYLMHDFEKCTLRLHRKIWVHFLFKILTMRKNFCARWI